MINKILSALFLLAVSMDSIAQDSIQTTPYLEGYAEVYYSFDSQKPSDHTRASYVYAHNRHNEFNLNIGVLKAGIRNESFRGNLGLMTGTYANANLSNEPGVLKMIYEGNVGIKLTKNKNLWVDAGVLPSHIGYESAIGKDCWTLSRSLTADNTPYFETGIRLSYTSQNERWYAAALALNGWQRIQRQNGNEVISLGTQLTYKAGEKLLLNSSTFIGSDTPDSVLCMRYFHNFYGSLQISKRIQVLVGADYGVQQKNKNSTTYSEWFSSSYLIRFKLNKKSFLTGRYENYFDKSGVIVASANGFETSAMALNLDLLPKANLLWRLESKLYAANDKIYLQNQQPSYTSWVISSALAVSF